MAAALRGLGPALLWLLLAAPPPRPCPGAGLLVAAQFEQFAEDGQTAIGQYAPVEVCKKQEKALGAKNPSCGLRWAIWNTARVPEFWEVHELEFYWDNRCTLRFAAGQPVSLTTNSAAALRENVRDRAWDKDERTQWTSECNVLTAGCKPWTQWIGTRLSDSDPTLNSDPTKQFATIRCLRILQSPNVTKMSKEIATVVWANDTDLGFEVIATYGDLGGGFWSMRPAREAGLWRLWNAEATARPWEVGELLLYSDLFCEHEVSGMPLASGTFGVPQTLLEKTFCYDLDRGCPSSGCLCDAYAPKNAFNGVRLPGFSVPIPLPGFWRAPCHPYLGCAEMEAWIGVDFDSSPVVVNCIRIQQPTHEGWPTFGYPHFSSRLLLQGWTGYEWQTERTFTGMAEGNWSDTRPESGMAWRITNYDLIPEAWEVHELALYEEERCGAVSKYSGGPGVTLSGLGGTPIDANPALRFSDQERECRLNKGSCSALAFDMDVGTAWRSDCSPCLQREAWVGIMFRGTRLRTVRCFRFYQSPSRLHRTEALELGVWDGNKWTVERFESGIGGGTWNHRPADHSTAWRLIGTSDTVGPWTVAGLHFYADRACSGEELTAEPVACGSVVVNPVANAFDFDPEGITQWVVSCAPPYTGSLGCARGAAWVGLQTEGEPLDVQCVRLKQHRLRAQQMASAVVELFDGIRWTAAPSMQPFAELGGGSWQTLPGSRGSMWRLNARPVPGGFGVGFSELGLYRKADCTGDPIPVHFPDVAPIGSGHASAREIQQETGYTAHLTIIGEAGLADPGMAFDGDYATFWADLDLLKAGAASSPWQGWIGIDMTSQVTDLQCVRFAPAPVRSLQPAWAEFQGWDGAAWASQASMATQPTLVIPLPSPSTGGWQRRPAPVRSMWRIQNGETLATWEVVEAELYERIDCGSAVLVATNAIGSAISAASGVAQGGHRLPARAFDGSLETRWAADCPQGCGPGEAWVGLSFSAPQSVKCMRLFQSGRYERQARVLTLATWLGDRWGEQARYSGLGGNSWNMRPAGPDTLWRVAYVERQDEECLALPARPAYPRSWGVTELELFADDACTEKLKGRAIASGSWEDTATTGLHVDESALKVFAPSNVNDGDLRTFWGAGCKATTASPRAKCLAGEEWIGLDVGQANGGVPVDVRCVTIYQSRAMMKQCCDPAKTLRLDRWNGSAWAEAAWRHLQDEGKPPIIIAGGFSSLGICPSVKDKLLIQGEELNPGVLERRGRRHSETCEIPLSGAIKLLSDRMCEKHPLCAEAGFGKTVFNCCPMNGAISVSKCCCDVPRWNIFEDQLVLGIDRAPIETYPLIGIEYVIIRMVLVMPWLGIIVSFLFFLIASAPRPRSQKGCRHRLWRAVCGPLQHWLAGDGMTPAVLRLLVRRPGGERCVLTLAKLLVTLCAGFFFGGFSIWIAISVFVAEVMLKIMTLFALIIRWAKSPYDPREPAEAKRLTIVLAVPFSGDGVEKPNMAAIMAGVLKSVAMFVTYSIQAMFDIILLRFAFMNMAAVDLSVTMLDIMVSVPQLPLRLEWLTSRVYELLSVAGKLYMEAFTQLFVGVPRCEGPVLVFTGMWLVTITLILIRWLNYDYFGLLAAVKQTLMTTRPMFQKAISVGAALGFRTGIFMFMQIVMLLFTRALSLMFGVPVNPLEKSVGWQCPYEDEAFVIIIGRCFLIMMGVGAMTVTFLCANGHFLGKHNLTESWSKVVQLDLSSLDPEVERATVLRWSTGFNMFPSTLGLWFDSWNVKGFLIEERARLYAEELRYPTKCDICGTYHLPYKEIIKATAVQLSLAWQLFPFIGPIVGKACEYFNNPPLFYSGTLLKCFSIETNVQKVRDKWDKKASAGGQVRYGILLAVAYLKDKGVNFGQRMLGIGMYAALLYFTYVIDKDNLQRKAVQMFQVVLALALAQGLMDFLVPLLLLVFLAGMTFLFAKPDAGAGQVGAGAGAKVLEAGAAEQLAAVGKPSVWPWIGQVVHGVSLGSSVAVYMLDAWKDRDLSRDFIVLVGVGAGLAAGMFIMVVALALEYVPGSRLPANLFFAAYSCGLALLVAFWGAHAFSFGVQAAIAVGAGIILMNVTGLAFRPPGIIGHGGPRAKSSVLLLLTTPQAMAGPFGIYAGVFAATMPYLEIVSRTGKYEGFAICAALGFIGGLIYAFATFTLCDRKPGQYAMAVGTGITVSVGVFFHWFVGMVLGSVIGSFVGAYMEARMMKEVDKMSLEPPRFTRSKVMAAAGLAKGAPEEPDQDLQLALGPPTVVRAETPTRTGYPGEESPLALGPAPAGHPLALPQEGADHLALTWGRGSGAGAAAAYAASSGSGSGAFSHSGLGAEDDATGPPGAGAARGALGASMAMARRAKKYGLGASATNIVALQGAPGSALGASRKAWHGPPREDEEEDPPVPAGLPIALPSTPGAIFAAAASAAAMRRRASSLAPPESPTRSARSQSSPASARTRAQQVASVRRAPAVQPQREELPPRR